MRIGRVEASAFDVPTAAPESDGTAEWTRTTLVVVELAADEEVGLGYTYASPAAARLVLDVLAPRLREEDAYDVRGIFDACCRAVRNLGREGLAAMAISAVDNAAWDLKAKLLGVPLWQLLGRVRLAAPAYGSGGFTSLSDRELEEQLGAWARDGFRWVKMKVGRGRDLERVHLARKAIGQTELFVDANGAFSRKQAIDFGRRVAELGVTWFEEPVPRSDWEGLAQIRDRVPMEVAGGEYGWQPSDYLHLARHLDVVQADVTRCGGVSGFLAAYEVCRAQGVPMSSHCAPMQHVPLVCALPGVRHLEWFYDHQRIERMLFDGFIEPDRGSIEPTHAPGFGLSLKRADAERFRTQI